MTITPEQGDMDQVCSCGRKTTAEFSFCPSCGKELRGKSLCRTLSACAEYTFERLADGHREGQAPGEVGLTEHHLQDIRMQHGDRVAVRWFTGPEEAVNGADWEWWFYAGEIGFGMRVQAKRAERSGSYKLRYRPNGGRLQSDLLIEDAVAAGCLPAYVFYNHLNWQPARLAGALAGCRHGPLGERQLGCTIASALVVQRTLLERRASTNYVKNRSLPWHRLLCDEGAPDGRRLAMPYERVRSLHRAAAEELQEALDGKGDAFTVERDVPSQPASPKPNRQVRHTDPVLSEPARVSSSESVDDLPRDLRQWPLYRRMQELAERPPSQLPLRVRNMIHGGDAIPPDERAAGAVLVNLAEDDYEEFHNARYMAEASPAGAVVTAWNALQRLCVEVLVRHPDVTPTHTRPGMSLPGYELGRQLAEVGLPEQAVGLFERLRKLRNAAAHGTDTVTTTEALSFVDSCMVLARELDQLP
ncbi:DUF6615 family protein [Streptomyces sp. NPDC048197]|uniref:DUF6615 family protein n=1 Tax=Streptomyces sp. NPDC048197 TaxID=3365511 RepID=UPI003712F728